MTIRLIIILIAAFKIHFENDDEQQRKGKKLRKMKTSLIRGREASAPMLNTDFGQSRADSDHEVERTPESKIDE